MRTVLNYIATFPIRTIIIAVTAVRLTLMIVGTVIFGLTGEVTLNGRPIRFF